MKIRCDDIRYDLDDWDWEKDYEEGRPERPPETIYLNISEKDLFTDFTGNPLTGWCRSNDVINEMITKKTGFDLSKCRVKFKALKYQ